MEGAALLQAGALVDVVAPLKAIELEAFLLSTRYRAAALVALRLLVARGACVRAGCTIRDVCSIILRKNNAMYRLPSPCENATPSQLSIISIARDCTRSCGEVIDHEL